MSASLGQLLVVFIRNQRQMHIDRHLPSKRLVESCVLGRGRKILVAAHHMGNVHGVVIYYIGKIVGGITVRFYQYHIVKLTVVYRDVPVKFIMEGGSALRRIILSDDKRRACRQLLLYLLFGKGQAVLIINHDFLALHDFRLQGSKSLLVTEAIIRLAFVNQLLRVFHVDTCLHTLTLDIRSKAAVLIRSLIML